MSAMPDFPRRIAITLAAVVAFLAGARIPIPGLDLDALDPVLQSPTSGVALDRFSVMALGIMPLLNALILAEILLLLIPPLQRWHTASADANRSWNRSVLAISLAFALLQAYGMANALESFPALVPDHDSFLQTAVLTLLAGSLLAVWLAHMIDRHGIGNGLWVLFLMPAIAVLPQKFATFKFLVETGSIRNEVAIASTAVALATIAGVLLLLTNRDRSDKGGIEGIAWPVMLGGVAAAWIWTAFLLTRHGGEIPVSDTPGQLIELSPYAMGLLIFCFAFVYARHTETPGTAAKNSLWLAVAASLPAVAAKEFQVPMLMEGTSLAILAAVAYSASQLTSASDGKTV